MCPVPYLGIPLLCLLWPTSDQIFHQTWPTTFDQIFHIVDVVFLYFCNCFFGLILYVRWWWWWCRWSTWDRVMDGRGNEWSCCDDHAPLTTPATTQPYIRWPMMTGLITPDNTRTNDKCTSAMLILILLLLWLILLLLLLIKSSRYS